MNFGDVLLEVQLARENLVADLAAVGSLIGEGTTLHVLSGPRFALTHTPTFGPRTRVLNNTQHSVYRSSTNLEKKLT